MENVIAYFATLVSLISLDGLWIGLIAHNFYTSRLGFLFSDHIAWWPLFIFYPLFAAGLFFFAVHPALSPNLPWKALLFGGFIGLLAYSAYDLTNQASISSWPVMVTVVDIAWGIVVSGLASMIGIFVARLFPVL